MRAKLVCPLEILRAVYLWGLKKEADSKRERLTVVRGGEPLGFESVIRARGA
jgi:hypothetical protein